MIKVTEYIKWAKNMDLDVCAPSNVIRYAESINETVNEHDITMVIAQTNTRLRWEAMIQHINKDTDARRAAMRHMRVYGHGNSKVYMSNACRARHNERVALLLSKISA